MELAAINKGNHEEHPKNSQTRDTNVSRIQDNNITQVSEEIEGSMMKKLSKEFSRTKGRNLGAFSKLDEFLLNPQVRVHSGSVPKTSWNPSRKNQEPNEDRCQNDPQPEARVFLSRSSPDCCLGDAYDSFVAKNHGGVYKIDSSFPWKTRIKN